MSTPCVTYVMISFSKDGGNTWSHEIKKPLVTCKKNYLNRVILNGRHIGSAYNLVIKLRYSDNGPFTLVSAHADVSPGI